MQANGDHKHLGVPANCTNKYIPSILLCMIECVMFESLCTCIFLNALTKKLSFWYIIYIKETQKCKKTIGSVYAGLHACKWLRVHVCVCFLRVYVCSIMFYDMWRLLWMHMHAYMLELHMSMHTPMCDSTQWLKRGICLYNYMYIACGCTCTLYIHVCITYVYITYRYNIYIWRHTCVCIYHTNIDTYKKYKCVCT